MHGDVNNKKMTNRIQISLHNLFFTIYKYSLAIKYKVLGTILNCTTNIFLIVRKTTLNCFRLDQYDECILTFNIGDLIWASFLVHCTAQINMPSVILKFVYNYFINSIDLEKQPL